MRLLHTSDWHLGRFLRTVPLIDHQRDFLAWLAREVEVREVDAVLVSGDVYDRAIPSAEAVPLLQEGLLGLVPHCPVIIVPGNHDSATRLGFGAPLLEAARVHLRASVDDVARPILLRDTDGTTLLVYGVPYLEPEVVRHALDADKSHASVLEAAMDRVRADIGERRREAASRGELAPRAVVMAHAFITGGLPSDSERDVSVGGVADAPAQVFDGVDYVALGHLHAPQEIAATAGLTVRYSGSPLPYSFSEEEQHKSVTIVDVSADGTVSVELVPTPVPRRLRTITGDLDDLLADPDLADAHDCWVRAIVTDARRPERPMDRLRERFPHTLELIWQPHVDGRPLDADRPRIEPTGTDPADIVTGFVEHVTGQPPTDAEVELIRASVERVRIAEVSS